MSTSDARLAAWRASDAGRAARAAWDAAEGDAMSTSDAAEAEWEASDAGKAAWAAAKVAVWDAAGKAAEAAHDIARDAGIAYYAARDAYLAKAPSPETP